MASCGDWYVRAGVEGCDDGNLDKADACTNLCAVATCGDGYLHVGVEDCDDAMAPQTCWTCEIAYWESVGQYAVGAGPGWQSNPPTYTCVEACGEVFGDAPYGCSTVDGTLNHLAFVDGWGDTTHCGVGGEVSDEYSLNDPYDCGDYSCSFSAYVNDHGQCFGSVNYCWQPWIFVNSYLVASGPDWNTNPPTYSCVEACAAVFGGDAADYACSTSNTMVNHLAYVDGWGDTTHCAAGGEVADDYKLNDPYDCGDFSCSFSAYVNDHPQCDNSLNYCWRH